MPTIGAPETPARGVASNQLTQRELRTILRPGQTGTFQSRHTDAELAIIDAEMARRREASLQASLQAFPPPHLVVERERRAWQQAEEWRHARDWRGELVAAHAAYRDAADNVEGLEAVHRRAVQFRDAVATRGEGAEAALAAAEKEITRHLVETFAGNGEAPAGNSRTAALRSSALQAAQLAVSHGLQKLARADEALATIEGNLDRARQHRQHASRTLDVAALDLLADYGCDIAAEVAAAEAVLDVRRSQADHLARFVQQRGARLRRPATEVLPAQLERLRHATTLPSERDWEEIFARLVGDPTTPLADETAEAQKNGAADTS
jgi:hypothetical protein